MSGTQKVVITSNGTVDVDDLLCITKKGEKERDREGMRREKDISIPFIKTYYFVFYGIVILSMSNFVIA